MGTGQAFPSPGEDEDCLFLDVYAPSGASETSKLPVYFFIQGGGFISDSNANFNGSGLVIASKMNIVVVNFNYRVGAFGFLASEKIRENGDLNAGILDQLKALEWVQRHISKVRVPFSVLSCDVKSHFFQFGGNPKHVVLGGASAGAGSIALLLTSYGGKDLGLFHGAIGESQFLPMLLTVEQSEFSYASVVKLAGCQNAFDSLACLRSASTENLQKSNVLIPYQGHTYPPLFTYGPVLDGVLLQNYTFQLFSEGKFVKVPTVFG